MRSIARTWRERWVQIGRDVMTSSDPQVPWTDEQWALVRQAVQKEASRSRVAATFLPLYGPLAGDADFVKSEKLDYMDSPFPVPKDGSGAGSKVMFVDEQEIVPLTTLQVRVVLHGAQMADAKLTSALEMFRRASNVIARLEDAIVFRGQKEKDQGPPDDALGDLKKIWTVRGGHKSGGLLEKNKFYKRAPVRRTDAAKKAEVLERAMIAADAAIEAAAAAQDEAKKKAEAVAIADAAAKVGAEQQAKAAADAANAAKADADRKVAAEATAAAEADAAKSAEAVNSGQHLVHEVSQKIGNLEGEGHFGPFAVVLGQTLFARAQTASAALLLPSDRIIPFLGGGPLLRSSTLPHNEGIVVALGAAPVELVVATDISVGFLQVTTDPLYVFRVFEKIALRVKEKDAIEHLSA